MISLVAALQAHFAVWLATYPCQKEKGASVLRETRLLKIGSIGCKLEDDDGSMKSERDFDRIKRSAH